VALRHPGVSLGGRRGGWLALLAMHGAGLSAAWVGPPTDWLEVRWPEAGGLTGTACPCRARENRARRAAAPELRPTTHKAEAGRLNSYPREVLGQDKRRTHITAQGIGDRKEVAQAICGADETRYRGEGTQDTECT